METCAICKKPIHAEHPPSRMVDGKLQFAHLACADKINAQHHKRETKLDGNRIVSTSVTMPATSSLSLKQTRPLVITRSPSAGFHGEADDGCWWISAAVGSEADLLEAKSIRLFSTEAEAQEYHAAHGYPVVAWKIIGESNETKSTAHEPETVRGPEAAVVEEKAKHPRKARR